jgi:hypothetical protein
MSVIGNRPLTAIPPPGMVVRENEWTHSNAHIKLVEKKPNPSLQQLFKKLIVEELGHDDGLHKSGEERALNLQQMALRCVISDPNVIELSGMKNPSYVDDALTVLRSPKFDPQPVRKLYSTIHVACEELGAEGNSIWG